MESLSIRAHNDKAFHANINGHKMDYINPDAAAIRRQILKTHAAQERAENGRA
jgi:hypothetical protein